LTEKDLEGKALSSAAPSYKGGCHRRRRDRESLRRGEKMLHKHLKMGPTTPHDQRPKKKKQKTQGRKEEKKTKNKTQKQKAEKPEKEKKKYQTKNTNKPNTLGKVFLS